MIGKLVEIHPDDAYFCDMESLMGSLWEISEMFNREKTADGNDATGFFSGYATYAGTYALEYTSSFQGDSFPMKFEVGSKDSTVFYAVKFEILENDEVK